jgi:spermidine synthase
VLPWITLDVAAIPAGGELRLMRRGGEFSIMSGPVELMNSRRGGSEQALADLACARLSGRSGPQVLIGGLGMGFTLRAALADLPGDARITVAELVPAVVAWARGPLAEISGVGLADARVVVHQGDVGELIRSAAATYDAILLDVDNGPDGLTRTSNDSLYEAEGLRAAYKALRAGGILAVWSAGPDKGFAQRLQRAGFTVEEATARSGGKRGARHIVWLASRPG